MADISIPKEIIDWMNSKGWGDHHIQWHIERRWDRFKNRDLSLAPNRRVIPWALSQGWKRHHVQEGAKTNGLEFLAMHRIMILSIVKTFPQHKDLFKGWEKVPTNHLDPDNPVSPTNNNYNLLEKHFVTGINRIENELHSFNSEDVFGIYVQTTDLPTQLTPLADTKERGAGIHNHLHGRFTHEGSPITMANPIVNIRNRMFWRLHGWIDKSWTTYRDYHSLQNNDQTYKSALLEGAKHMRVKDLLFPDPLPEHIIKSTPKSHTMDDHHHHHRSLEIPHKILESILSFTYSCNPVEEE